MVGETRARASAAGGTCSLCARTRLTTHVLRENVHSGKESLNEQRRGPAPRSHMLCRLALGLTVRDTSTSRFPQSPILLSPHFHPSHPSTGSGEKGSSRPLICAVPFLSRFLYNPPQCDRNAFDGSSARAARKYSSSLTSSLPAALSSATLHPMLHPLSLFAPAFPLLVACSSILLSCRRATSNAAAFFQEQRSLR